MSKTSISGVLWGNKESKYVDGFSINDMRKVAGYPPITETETITLDPSQASKGWGAIGKEFNESFRTSLNKAIFDEIQNRCDERRAADMLARGIARSRRSNSEGFGE